MYNVDKIFDLLKERGIEQKDLAKAIGASAGNITDWKKGRATPSSKVIPKIANFFHLPISDFYVYDTDNTAPSNQKDSPNGIEESEEYVQLMTAAKDLTPEELKVVIATAKALNAQQKK